MSKIVTKTQNSGARAGAASTTHTFGDGKFLITSLSVSAGLTTDRIQAVRVQYRHRIGDGTFEESFIAAGFFTPNQPFVITNIEFDGPGEIKAFVFHLDTTSHNLAISHRRVSHAV